LDNAEHDLATCNILREYAEEATGSAVQEGYIPQQEQIIPTNNTSEISKDIAEKVIQDGHQMQTAQMVGKLVGFSTDSALGSELEMNTPHAEAIANIQETEKLKILVQNEKLTGFYPGNDSADTFMNELSAAEGRKVKHSDEKNIPMLGSNQYGESHDIETSITMSPKICDPKGKINVYNDTDINQLIYKDQQTGFLPSEQSVTDKSDTIFEDKAMPVQLIHKSSINLARKIETVTGISHNEEDAYELHSSKDLQHADLTCDSPPGQLMLNCEKEGFTPISENLQEYEQSEAKLIQATQKQPLDDVSVAAKVDKILGYYQFDNDVEDLEGITSGSNAQPSVSSPKANCFKETFMQGFIPATEQGKETNVEEIELSEKTKTCKEARQSINIALGHSHKTGLCNYREMFDTFQQPEQDTASVVNLSSENPLVMNQHAEGFHPITGTVDQCPISIGNTKLQELTPTIFTDCLNIAEKREQTQGVSEIITIYLHTLNLMIFFSLDCIAHRQCFTN
jgi:hypothetical protein